jgi:hypothetical protein
VLLVTFPERFASIMTMAEDAASQKERQVNRRTAARLGWSLFTLAGLLFVVALVLNLRRDG